MKEDMKNALDWLNEIISNPEGWQMFYSDSETKICAEAALALLKEQEAVEPEVEVLNEIDRLYRCPKCHKCFFYEKQKYCDYCGKSVKWE